MFKKIILLLASSLLFSCATTKNAPEASSSIPKETKEASLRLADLRPDLSAVVTAIYGMLREPETPLTGTVLFDRPLLVDSTVTIEGFGLADVAIEEDLQIGDDPLFRKLSGIMRLADPSGREIYWSYNAEYLLQDDGILILSSAAAPIFGNFNKMRFFFVEKDQLPDLSYLKDATFVELLPLIAANASTPKDLNATDGMKEMYLFVFDMTLSEQSIDLELYSDGTIADAVLASSTSINQKGWRFIKAEGSFRFGHKTEYTLYAAEARKTGPRVLSVLSVYK